MFSAITTPTPILAAAESSELLPDWDVLILIGIGAFTLPLLARRIGLPAVVLEILFGLALGPAVFQLVTQGSSDIAFIEFLAQIGLLLLMFLAGFEIDFERLERQGPGPILAGLAVFALILASAWFGFGLLSLESTNQRIFLMLLTSAASLGIIIPALRSTARTSTTLGQLTIVTGVLAEFLSATAIVIFGVWITSGGFTWDLLAVPALFVILATVLFVVRRLAWWYPDRFERLFATHDPDEIGIRASLAMLFVFVGISVGLNVEPILGAFLAGAAFSFVFRNTGDLEARLSGVSYGFFIPVFFISVGIAFPLDALSEPGVLANAIGLIVIAIAIKIVPALVFRLRGLTLRESAASGVLLAGQLSVIIAFAAYGKEDLGVIDDGLEAGAILLVGVTAIFSPIVFRMLAPPLADESSPDVAEQHSEEDWVS